MNKQETQDLQIVIAKHQAKKTKEILNSFEDSKKAGLKKWLIAASFIVILGVSSFWFLNKEANSEKLFAEYYAPYQNVVQPISRTDKIKNTKTLAFENYELKKYTEALKEFDILLLNQKENSDVITFYKAIIYLELNEPQKAIDLLKNNFKNSTNWIDKKYWYLALAYLKVDNQTEAKRVLIELSKMKINFKRKATLSLLKSLN